MVIARYTGMVVLLAAVGTIAVWSLRERLGDRMVVGVALGAGLAAAGTISGMALSAWAFNRKQGQFFAALMLGMLGRLLLYGAVLVYVALRTSIQPLTVAVTLMGYYVLFQVLEIRFALKGLKRMGGGNE